MHKNMEQQNGKAQDMAPLPPVAVIRPVSPAGMVMSVWDRDSGPAGSGSTGSVVVSGGLDSPLVGSSGSAEGSWQVKVEGDPWVNPNPDSFKLSKTDFTLKPSESTWQMKIKRNDHILCNAAGIAATLICF